MNTKKAVDGDAAWDLQDFKKDEPHGWVQWKGTNVCMDLHCGCGRMSHIDASFTYSVKCPYCDRVYFCSGHIEFIELEREPEMGAILGDAQ